MRAEYFSTTVVDQANQVEQIMDGVNHDLKLINQKLKEYPHHFDNLDKIKLQRELRRTSQFIRNIHKTLGETS